jgi:lipopolysaccharide transport system ATP-binding protein
MSSEPIVIAENLGRLFHLYDSPRDRLAQAFLWGRRKLYRDFWALRGVSFRVQRGRSFGVIGRNGSGKSTLLQIVAGTLRPSEGTCETLAARTAALLELGSGFNPEFSGRENVYVNGAILGLSRREIEHRFEEILDFAEIGEFIDQPIKNYSSGMVVRLAFAVQVCVEPDLLIVDEALSVGDMFFQQKCFEKIESMMARGLTLLFVSHDADAVKTLCEDALVLDRGSSIFCGPSSEAVDRYSSLLADGSATTAA